MGIGERLKYIRKSEGLTQAEFGAKLGVSESAISNYESEKRPLSDSLIKLVCKTFKYYYDWLSEGVDPPKIEAKIVNATIDALEEEFALSDFDKKIMEAYLSFSPEERDAIRKFIKIIRDA